jgi:hypothetical protein
MVLVVALAAAACAGGHSSPGAGGASQDGSAGTRGSAGASGSAGPSGPVSADGSAGAGGATTASGDAAGPPPTGTPGAWEDVTSPAMPASLFTGASGFGVGNIVVDPARASDLYVGGYGSIWKSSDFGATWAELPSSPNPPYLPLGHVLAVAGTTPATLWMANVIGDMKVFKSTDAGLTFSLTGTLSQKDDSSLYSIVVDPHDPTHLLSGFHESDAMAESTDGGETWKVFTGAGWPTGGISWFPFFVEMGSVATTRRTWLAIAQDGASAIMTSDGGATWTQPKGLEGLQHPHGCSQLYQSGQTLFIAGIQGPGDGVYRSADLGATWTRVAMASEAIVWGSAKFAYAMWGWACASCGLSDGGPNYQTAAQPGTNWAKGPALPAQLVWGPNSVAVTSDGTHSIFVGSMWATGLWRYVEP